MGLRLTKFNILHLRSWEVISTWSWPELKLIITLQMLAYYGLIYTLYMTSNPLIKNIDQNTETHTTAVKCWWYFTNPDKFNLPLFHVLLKI